MPLTSLEDLVNPPSEQEDGENPDMFASDADIVEAVHKQVSKEDKDEVEEISPPQMSQPAMAKLSEDLQSVCLGAEVEIGFELLKMLRKFEAQVWAIDLQESTQQNLDE